MTNKKRIDSLTKDQEQILVRKREEWIGHGLATGPTNKQAVTHVLREVYKEAGVDIFPETIYWEASPWALYKKIKEVTGAFPTTVAFGSHDADFISWHDTFTALGLEETTKPVQPLVRLSKLCGWWAAYDEAVFVSDRPMEIHMDADGRLHNETGAALLYSDGEGVWSVNGVVVTKQIIESPQTLTFSQISQESNAEVRRIMIDRYGPGKFLEEGNATVRDHDDRWGTLYALPGDQDIVICKVVNRTQERDGHYKEYYLVGSSDMRTAHEFNARAFNLPQEEYQPSVES